MLKTSRITRRDRETTHVAISTIKNNKPHSNGNRNKAFLSRSGLTRARQRDYLSPFIHHSLPVGSLMKKQLKSTGLAYQTLNQAVIYSRDLAVFLFGNCK